MLMISGLRPDVAIINIRPEGAKSLTQGNALWTNTMPQSLTKVYVHITFSTKHRNPSIGKDIEQELWNYIGGICKALECSPIRVGGYNDHVHICCLLSRKISQSKLLGEIKRQSSKWIKTKGREYEKFYWQDGYGVFAVNPMGVERVVKYIENQHEHHKKRSFQEELLAFLKKYNVNFDERYLWDWFVSLMKANSLPTW